jgi:hypothetical protein
MNPILAKVRHVLCLPILLAFSVALVACGGGGTGSNPSGNTTGAASVGVSLMAAPSFPAGTAFAPSTASPVGTAAPATTTFDHVWVTITKLALIPSAGPEFPDQNGELEEINNSSEEGNGGMGGFVTIVLPSPVLIDLLHPPTGDEVAKILNKFSEVPAGEYSKIRVYYDSVLGETPGGDNVLFHQTAHFHFDVHFVGGNLVVPVATDPNGGIRFFSIVIDVVGLKIQQAGNSGKFLLRPQVFATVGVPEYIISGEAQNVNPADNTFDIHTSGGETIHAVYGAGTDWLFVDPSIPRSVTVTPFLGSSALRNTAIVDAIGSFSPDKVLLADEVDITFPATKSGKVFLGWNPDNTFTLRLPSDNTVFPMPSRTTAYYDNAVAPFSQLTDAAIVDNAAITARGYAVTGGIDAFWISIGP